MTTEATRQAITAIIGQYSGDNTFWRFIDDFAATVDLDLKNSNIERIGNLLNEGARRYEWLREFEPNHFARLNETDPEKLKTLVAVVDWAIVENLPVSHYSRSGNREPSMFAAFAASRLAASKFADRVPPIAAVTLDNGKIVEYSAPIEYVYDGIKTPSADIFQTAAPSEPENAPVTPTPISEDDLKAFAVKAYESVLGKVIKVQHYAVSTGDNYYPAADTTILAVVTETPSSEIGIREDHEGEIGMRSTWSVRLMTGEHRGETGFVHAPEFNSDGQVDPQWVVTTGSTVNDYAAAWLSEEDLVQLVRLDCIDLGGKTVTMGYVQAYVGETDDQGSFSFDPPFVATVDPFNFEAFERHYRIDHGDEGGDLVIDMTADISSTDERVGHLRSMWCDMAAYHLNGKIEPNNGVVDILAEEPEYTGPKI
jgi:hypothetical protein